jgi:hypothetical protein
MNHGRRKKTIFEMIRRMREIWFIIFSRLRFIDLQNKVPWRNGPNWLKYDSQIRLMLFMPEGGWPQFHLIILINNVCSYCITQKRRRNKRPKGVLRFCMWSVFFCQPVLMSISHYVPYNIIFTLALKVSKIWKWRSSKVWRYFEEVIKHLIRRPGNTMVKREIHIINDRHKNTQET